MGRWWKSMRRHHRPTAILLSLAMATVGLPALASSALAGATASVSWQTTVPYNGGATGTAHGEHGINGGTLQGTGWLAIDGAVESSCNMNAINPNCDTYGGSGPVENGECVPASAWTQGTTGTGGSARATADFCPDSEEGDVAPSPDDLPSPGDLPCNPAEGEMCSIEDAQSSASSLLCPVVCN